MSIRLLRFKQLRAVRMIRAGSTPDQVCKALRLQPDSIRAWESACQNVPDDILEHTFKERFCVLCTSGAGQNVSGRDSFSRIIRQR